MTQADSKQPVPVAIIGMGCLFPMADDLARFWSNIRGRLDAITEVPPTHWRPEDYWDEDPKAADRTYARRGGFLTPVDFPLLDFGIAPTPWRPPTPPSSSASWWPARRWSMPATGRIARSSETG